MHQIVTLPNQSPDKPAFGSPCNGCGLCCAAELCPLGRVMFRHKSGPCPALVWRAEEKRHVCGLATEPARHLPRLPGFLAPIFARLARRWIAAGSGCDSDVTAITAGPAAIAERDTPLTH